MTLSMAAHALLVMARNTGAEKGNLRQRDDADRTNHTGNTASNRCITRQSGATLPKSWPGPSGEVPGNGRPNAAITRDVATPGHSAVAVLEPVKP
jgi:hypothetical protein